MRTSVQFLFATLATVLCVATSFAAAPGLDSSDPLVAVDRNRQSIIADIVSGFQGELATVAAGREAQESAALKDRLSKLRADHLLAASLASSLASLKSILEESESTTRKVVSASREKVFGDANRDLVYTPLTPCRLIDTRGFGAPIQGGVFAPNARRNYVPQGLCAIPTSGVASLLISFTTQNMTPNSGGYLAILAPGAPVTASVDVFNLGAEWSASNTAVATGPAGQFDVLVAAATSHVVIDILGYFAPPQGAGGTVPSGFMILGLGTTAPAGYTYAGPVFDQWTSRPSMPTARNVPGAAALNGKLYVIGGFPATGLNEQFDLATSQWTTRAPMPTARYQVTAAAANNRIYLIGGLGGTTTNEEYDPVGNTWATRAPMPTGRYGIGLGVVSGKIYAIGGVTTSSVTTNEQYDPVANTWTPRAAMPTARDLPSVGVLNGKIYVVGGRNGSTALAANEEYDPVANTWTAKAPMPNARFSAGAAVLNGRLYVFGGFATGYLAFNEEYDPLTNTWATRTAMDVPHQTTGVEANGRIFALAGFGPTFAATLDEYSVSPYSAFVKQ